MLPFSYWWGKYNPSTKKHDATDLMKVEVAAWKEQFREGSQIEITADTDWDTSFWVKVDRLEKGFDELNNFYLILTMRMADTVGRNGQPHWGNTSYAIKIIYPDAFPAVAPSSYITNMQISTWSTPHIFSDGRLCLFNPRDGRDLGWDPSQNTGASIALWSIQWIRAYNHYNKTGTWPGPDGHK